MRVWIAAPMRVWIAAIVAGIAVMAGCTAPSANGTVGNATTGGTSVTVIPVASFQAAPLPLPAQNVTEWDCASAIAVPQAACPSAALDAYAVAHACNAQSIDGGKPECVGRWGDDYGVLQYCRGAGSCGNRTIEVSGRFGNVTVNTAQTIKVSGPAMRVVIGKSSGDETLSVYNGTAQRVEVLAEGHGQAYAVGRIAEAFVSGDGGSGAAATFVGAARNLTLSQHRSDAPLMLTSFQGTAHVDRTTIQVEGVAQRVVGGREQDSFGLTGFNGRATLDAHARVQGEVQAMHGTWTDITFTGRLHNASLQAWGNGGSTVRIEGAPPAGANWTLAGNAVLVGRGPCTLDMFVHGADRQVTDGWGLGTGKDGHYTLKGDKCKAKLDLNVDRLSLVAAPA